ncbi:MAG: hypothetical protein BWY86_00939 [Candidatus Aminicenantes bacterium ADurb.Bin508]|nr:MAG: hypothetical protein BWY86_00939 [Candidatus Aminicenantes bacterium ADurb.Bin508]
MGEPHRRPEQAPDQQGDLRTLLPGLHLQARHRPGRSGERRHRRREDRLLFWLQGDLQHHLPLLEPRRPRHRQPLHRHRAVLQHLLLHPGQEHGDRPDREERQGAGAGKQDRNRSGRREEWPGPLPGVEEEGLQPGLVRRGDHLRRYRPGPPSGDPGTDRPDDLHPRQPRRRPADPPSEILREGGKDLLPRPHPPERPLPPGEHR